MERYEHLGLEWTNFLLACVNCNSTKGHQDIDEDDLLWPDKHNTFYALKYGPGALVEANADLQDPLKQKARELIKLVGLDKRAGDTKTASDRRWSRRQEAWDTAEHARGNLLKNDTEELRQSIALNARLNGFFSVWMTVFAGDADMRQRIIAEFPGTSPACFKDGECFTCVTR